MINSISELRDRLRWLRKNCGLNQEQAAEKIGTKVRTLQTHEAGQYPNRNNISKYIAFYACDPDWFITGKGEPFPGEKSYLIAEPCAHDIYGRSEDPLLSAISTLKQIFDSCDQHLIRAINSNLIVLQNTLLFHKQISSQIKELDNIKEILHTYEKRLSTLETDAQIHNNCLNFRESTDEKQKRG